MREVVSVAQRVVPAYPGCDRPLSGLVIVSLLRGITPELLFVVHPRLVRTFAERHDAVRSSCAAHWASWADSLPMIQKGHLAVARLIESTNQSDAST